MITVTEPFQRAGLRRAAGLLGVDDAELGARILRNIPTNESRPSADLLQYSRRAGAYGASLATSGTHRPGDDLTVVEHEGGLAENALARSNTRRGSIELFTDAIELCERLIDELDWRSLFPTGSVRACALAHERAHHAVTADRSRGLRKALGHNVIRIGRWHRSGYIAGADEIAAHAYAARVVGLRRSPLLITAAAAYALGSTSDIQPDSTKSEN